jgi:hypothetical protein
MVTSILLSAMACAAPSAGAAADAIALTGVHASGRYAAEDVRIRNTSSTTQTIPAASPSRYQLRLSKGRTRVIQLDDARLTIKPRQTATIRFSCLHGARKPRQSGATLYLCLDRGRGGYASVDVLPDAGAVIKLVDTASGRTLSRLAYGSAAA